MPAWAACQSSSGLILLLKAAHKYRWADTHVLASLQPMLVQLSDHTKSALPPLSRLCDCSYPRLLLCLAGNSEALVTKVQAHLLHVLLQKYIQATAAADHQKL